MVKVKEENAIPVMTSNTTPSGIASASSIFGTGNEAWRAFDGNSGTSSQWVTVSGATNGWLSYTFPIEKIITKYSIIGANDNTASPKTWTFEGSDDGIDWTILDTRINITFGVLEKLEFIMENRIPFKSYRLNVSSNNGRSNGLHVGELQMFELDFSNKFLILSSDGKVIGLEKGGYTGDLVPRMSSNTAPSGVVSASSSDASYLPYNAFSDGGTTTRWQTPSGTLVGWLAYEFSLPEVINKYTITNGNTTAPPKSWTFEGSNDNWITRDILDTRTNVTDWVTDVKKEFIFTNSNKYKSYRINVTANNGNTSVLLIGEMELMKSFPDKLKYTLVSEQNFISHGIDKSTTIDLQSPMTNKVFIEQSSTTLGSGKVFSRTIDTTKIPIKKVTIK